MRIRSAVSILTLSATFMFAGLGYSVSAQEDDGTTTRARRARPTPPASKSRTPARTPSRSGAAAGTDSDGPTEFESGVDYRPPRRGTRITFNLEDADLPDLVRLISNLTGRRFILPGKVRSIKATVYAPTQITVAEAWTAFVSILEANGMSVVRQGRYYKIIETSAAESSPLPVDTDGGRPPNTDQFRTHFVRLDSVSAEDAATLISRFKSREGQVTAYAPTNTLIITDTGRQIRRMMQIIRTIDVPRAGEQIWIEPVHYADAADLAGRLLEIFPADGPGGGAAPAAAASRSRPARPATKARGKAAAATPAAPSGPSTVGSSGGGSVRAILSDERTNSLIIMASERSYLRILEMIRRLDIPLEGEGRIHVHYIQNGDASEIADTLTTLIGGGSSRPSTPAAGGAAARRGGAAAAAAARAATPDLFEGAIRITAYEPTNSLVITSSMHDYAALRRVIEMLDAPRRQVFIEAVVMELSVTRSNSFGLSYHGGVPDFPTDDSLTILGFNAGGSLSPVNQESLTGLALGVRGPTIDESQSLIGLSIPGFGVVVNALASSGDANVLSTPHIMAMDNVQAEITVGENIPLQTSGIPTGALNSLGALGGLGGATGANPAAGLAGLAGLGGLGGGVGSVPRQDVGTTIRLTPHVNERDQVRLEIEEEISERGATEGDLGVVSINRRRAQTEVMVDDAQTVVIGGLVRETATSSESKIPILGDIPILGALFRRTESSTRKTNLLLFLTPYIIRDASDLRAIFERKMRERQEFIDRYFVFSDDDFDRVIDYSRTTGLVTEIIQELDRLDSEAELAAAAAETTRREHRPSAPVGSYVEPEEDSGGEGDDVVIIEPEGASGGGGSDEAPSDPPAPESGAAAPTETETPAPSEGE